MFGSPITLIKGFSVAVQNVLNICKLAICNDFIGEVKSVNLEAEQERSPDMLYLRHTPGDWSDSERASHTRLGEWWLMGGHCV